MGDDATKDRVDSVGDVIACVMVDFDGFMHVDVFEGLVRSDELCTYLTNNRDGSFFSCSPLVVLLICKGLQL